MCAKSKMGGDTKGEEGTTIVATRQRAPGPVGSLKEIEKGDGYYMIVTIFHIFLFLLRYVMISWRKPSERPQCVDNYDYRVTGGELTCERHPTPQKVLHDQVHDHDLQDHQVPQRASQSRKQDDDVVTFKLDCLKCDERYTFEVWYVDKEDNM